MRRWQEYARTFDRWFHPAEPDFPGLTFASPVEWAPWMETVWFGNYYDYRSAFFQDVMYSNSGPCREGALLFQDAAQAQQVALLYQRYKKFDDDSYAVSNATLFNLFGTTSMRVGRYKLPQGDDVLLCTTDPLTVSEMKRYLNSISFIKFFTARFFQQKRKRQYPMRVRRTATAAVTAQLPYADEFFPDAVHRIEYGRMTEDPLVLKHPLYGRAVGTGYTIPVLPSSLPASCVQDVTANQARAGGWGVQDSPYTPVFPPVLGAQLVLPLVLANSQYVLESLWQSVLQALVREGVAGDSGDPAELRLLLGGDGRLLNSFAAEQLLRVAAGNGLREVQVAKGNLLCSSAAEVALRQLGPRTVAIVLTAPGSAAGVRGGFGVQVILPQSPAQGGVDSHQGQGGAGDTVRLLGAEQWHRVLADIAQRRSVRLLAARPPAQALALLFNDSGREGTVDTGPVQFGGLTVRPFDPAPDYTDLLRSVFDLPLIRRYLAYRKPFLTVDCMHGPAALYLQPLLGELGLDASTCLFNERPRADFAGLVPEASARCALDSMDLFNAPVPAPTVEQAPASSVGVNRDAERDAERDADAGVERDAVEHEEKGSDTQATIQIARAPSRVADVAGISTAAEREVAEAAATIAASSAESQKPPAPARELSRTALGQGQQQQEIDLGSCPDLGFAIDANNARALVLFPGDYLSATELGTVMALAASAKEIASSSAPASAPASTPASTSPMDGASTVLAVLELLARLDLQLRPEAVATFANSAEGDPPSISTSTSMQLLAGLLKSGAGRAVGTEGDPAPVSLAEVARAVRAAHATTALASA